MNIGIWGLYDKGNFGDDLMAAMFYNFLNDKGHNITVYNASDYLKEELALNVMTNIDDFVRSNEVIVIGGGGMLVNNSLLRFLLKKTEFKFEYSFYKLLKATKKYSKKIIPISIGGGNASKLNNFYKNKLFSKQFTKCGTVRLESDLKLVSEKTFNYYPDIVLRTSDFFPIKADCKKGSSKRKIILNLKNKSAGPLISEFKKANIFEKFDVYSFSSHAVSKAEFGSYEFELPQNHFKFTKLIDGINFISNADLIISSKLHVGVTGCSYGIPFISYCGPQKAKEFLKQYSKSEWIENDPKTIVNNLLNFDNCFDQNAKTNNYREASLKHFDVLNQAVSAL
ncbi:MAG: polysaccharide pyruvyl transferase family protein [Leeuwenhoekiella sp.]